MTVDCGVVCTAKKDGSQMGRTPPTTSDITFLPRAVFSDFSSRLLSVYPTAGEDLDTNVIM